MANGISPEMIIRISGNSAKFDAELKKLETKAKIASGQISKEAVARQEITEKLLISSYKRIAVGFAAVTAGAALALKAFADYETALVAVQRTTGLAGTELDDFKKRIDGLSDNLNTPATELLKVAQVAGQLGVTGSANLAKFTETMAKFDIASSSLKGEAAASAFARIIKLSGGQIADVDRYASSVALLGDNFNATEAQITAVAEEIVKIGPVFRLNTSNALGMATGFAEIGVEAEIARSTLLLFGQKTDEVLRKGGDELKLFMALTGMTRDELQKNLKDEPEKIFVAFSKGLKDAGQDASLVLESLGLNSRQIAPALLGAAGSVEVFERALRDSNDEFQRNTKLNEETQKSLATTAKSWDGVKVAAVDLGRVLGEELKPAAEGLFFFLEWNLREIARLAGVVGGAFSTMGENFRTNAAKIRDFLGLPNESDLQPNEDDTKYKFDRIKKQHEEERKLLADHLEEQRQIKADAATVEGEEEVVRTEEQKLKVAEVIDAAKRLELEKEAEKREEKLEREQAEWEEDLALLDERLKTFAQIQDLYQIEQTAKEREAHLQKTQIGRQQLENEKIIAAQKVQVAKLEFAEKIGSFREYVSQGTALSKTLFLIQKAAAFASAIVSAHQAAALALANPPGPPATIPISKLALAMGYANAAGIAASAIQGFTGAQQGGRVPGGFGGGDSVPMLLEPGETVVPKMLSPTFEQFIRDERGVGGGNGGGDCIITLDPEAARIFTLRQREDSKLGVQR